MLMPLLIFLALLLDLVAWSLVPSEAEPVRLLRSLNPLVLLGLVFLVAAAAVGVWGVLRPRASSASRLLGAVLLLVLCPALRAFQLYSDLGVFLLNGSKHWIARAASTSDSAEAKDFLALVLSATQYGVNEAENQVLANYPPAEQARLFMLLAEVAPNERWRRRYLARSQAAVLRISGSPTLPSIVELVKVSSGGWAEEESGVEEVKDGRVRRLAVKGLEDGRKRPGGARQRSPR